MPYQGVMQLPGAMGWERQLHRRYFNMLKLVISLSRIGDQNLKITDIIKQITTLMAACYGQPQCSTMTEVGRSSSWQAST